MRLFFRPLAPRETDYELIGFAASTAGFALAASWFVLHLPWPVCLFHAVTGAPCLTCGATRSAVALLHGDVTTAFHWNPLAVVIYAAITMFDIYALAVLLTRGRRLRADFRPNERKIARGVIIGLLLANWAYLVAHARIY